MSEGKKAPDSDGLWVQNAAGLWIKIGDVKGLFVSPVDGFPDSLSVGYEFKPEATTEGVVWGAPPITADALAAMKAALPPFPPNHFDCKCALTALEEPPPPSARELAESFVARNQHPIECPPALELVGLLCREVGHTGGNAIGNGSITATKRPILDLNSTASVGAWRELER